jgi:hypothetical protein
MEALEQKKSRDMKRRYKGRNEDTRVDSVSVAIPLPPVRHFTNTEVTEFVQVQSKTGRLKSVMLLCTS